MAWIVVQDERFLNCESLVRDDDRMIVGTIMRFYEDGPAYAWTMSRGRIGPISHRNADGSCDPIKTDALARAKVEELAGL